MGRSSGAFLNWLRDTQVVRRHAQFPWLPTIVPPSLMMRLVQSSSFGLVLWECSTRVQQQRGVSYVPWVRSDVGKILPTPGKVTQFYCTSYELTFFPAIYPFDQIPSSGFSLKHLQCRTQNKLFCSTELQSITETVAYLLPLLPYFEEIRIMMFLRFFGRKCSRKYPAFGNIRWKRGRILSKDMLVSYSGGNLQWIRRKLCEVWIRSSRRNQVC